MAGTSYYRKAVTEHNVINKGNNFFTFIEVEIKGSNKDE